VRNYATQGDLGLANIVEQGGIWLIENVHDPELTWDGKCWTNADWGAAEKYAREVWGQSPVRYAKRNRRQKYQHAGREICSAAATNMRRNKANYGDLNDLQNHYSRRTATDPHRVAMCARERY